MAWKQVAKNMCRVEANVVKQKIKVKTMNVNELEVYLSPMLVDMNKEIQLYLNGRRKFKGLIKIDLAVMLQEVYRSGDTSRLKWAKIVVKQ